MPETEAPNITASLSLPKRLCDLMVETNIITQDELQKAIEHQRTQGGKLGTILVQLGYVKEGQLVEFIDRQCGVRFVQLPPDIIIDAEVLSKVPENLARQHLLIPIKLSGRTLELAAADPLNVLVFDDLKMMTGLEIVALLASEAEVLRAIEKNYTSQTAQGALKDIVESTGATEEEMEDFDVLSKDKEEVEAGDDIITLERRGEDSPVIKMVNLIISAAVKAKASDIHIEPFPKEIKLRFRIDGVLYGQKAPPKKFHKALVSRLKIMANLNIAEKRVPQDGRIKLKIQDKEYALRVSTLPCSNGEKVVMRILDSSGLQVNLNQLGFEPEALAVFQKCVKAPYGINLITGPTGSGKSTTLYSTLQQLNAPGINIMTVEDPVEYQVPGINQVQVNSEVGLTFAAGLRAFLRQDPNIIMVGEIRDLETMQIAINAALTGHLVFSTLHTNDAAGAITRMGMMGIEPFLMSSSLLMVVAQRLVRGICKQCRETYPVDPEWLLKLGVSKNSLQVSNGKVTLVRGKGCKECVNTGYRGRVGLYEILEVTDSVRELIMEKAPLAKLKEQARKQGMLSLRECGIRKLLAGVTTVEEMMRVTASDIS